MSLKIYADEVRDAIRESARPDAHRIAVALQDALDAIALRIADIAADTDRDPKAVAEDLRAVSASIGSDEIGRLLSMLDGGCLTFNYLNARATAGKRFPARLISTDESTRTATVEALGRRVTLPLRRDHHALYASGRLVACWFIPEFPALNLEASTAGWK